ncbi:unnamed protein product [Closterium sp. NIES-54]
MLHVAALRDYELHSVNFSTAFLQGSLHGEIWLRRPPGFTGLFPAGTQWSLLVYGLCQVPREWQDTLRMTLAALGFAPLTADPSLFLRTDISLPPFYVLVYIDDLVFATADTEALALLKLELQKRYTCTDLGELCSYLGLQITRDRARRTITLTQSHMVHQVLLRFGIRYSLPPSTPLPTGHSLSAPPSDESVESSGPYPELVGCLMVLRYLCSTSSMGLVLGGWGQVVLIGHPDASWVDNLATQRSSQGYTFSLGSGSVSWQSTHSSFVLSSISKAPLALVHMDVVGPTRAPSLSGSRYFLTIVDDHTRAMWVYPLKTKGEVTVAVLQEWMPRAQRESEHKVKVIRNDNGGEFIGNEFEVVLKKKGIQHQLTVPYNPQQNGMAERFNRTLHEGARTLLGREGLLDPFWVTALRQVALAKNMVLATVEDKQWVHPLHQVGWLVWDLTGQKLTVSRDVKFLESLYYKEWKQQQQKLPTTLLIIEADEVQRPSRQMQVIFAEEEISGVTEDAGEPEVEEQHQQQQQDAPLRAPCPPDRPRRDVRPPNRLTYPSFGKPKVVRAGSVAEKCDEDEIAHCYWAADPEPRTLAEALSGPDAEKWKQSVKEEYDSLLENETWELCELCPGKKAISSKLIFRHKYEPNGELTRYKSRLVAKGFQQTKGKDFDEIFAPVGKGTTLRVMLGTAPNRGWRIKQMDITTAFLNGIIL